MTVAIAGYNPTAPLRISRPPESFRLGGGRAPRARSDGCGGCGARSRRRSPRRPRRGTARPGRARRASYGSRARATSSSTRFVFWATNASTSAASTMPVTTAGMMPVPMRTDTRGARPERPRSRCRAPRPAADAAGTRCPSRAATVRSGSTRAWNTRRRCAQPRSSTTGISAIAPSRMRYARSIGAPVAQAHDHVDPVGIPLRLPHVGRRRIRVGVGVTVPAADELLAARFRVPSRPQQIARVDGVGHRRLVRVRCRVALR